MQVIFALAVQKERLPLPGTCPHGLRALITECWAEEPAERPPFDAVYGRLRDMRHELDADAGVPGRRASTSAASSIHATL